MISETTRLTATAEYYCRRRLLLPAGAAGLRASLKFECNPILAMTSRGRAAASGIGQMLAAGKTVDFVGINVLLSDYAGSGAADHS